MTDVLAPGYGYWVKVDTSGNLILNSHSVSASAHHIRIVPTDELPPPPPLGSSSASQRFPESYALKQSFPNPFNPSAVIEYSLPVISRVRLNVYNSIGQMVATLQDGVEGAGYKTVHWNGSDVASGIYFYRLQAVSISNPAITFNETRKMVLLK